MTEAGRSATTGRMAYQSPSDAPAIRFPPPLIFLGFLLLGLLVDWLLALPPLTIPWWIGAVVALAGGGLIAASVGAFRRHGEDPRPWTSTGEVNATGVYARSRNPMYLGMVLTGLGLSVALHSMTAAIFTLVAMTVVGSAVIRREEAYLEARFGDGYRAYRSRVRRWL